MRPWLRLCLLPAMLMAAIGAQAADNASSPELKAERARISAERASIAERFAAENRACHQRFAVNDCLRANSVWRRGVLQELQRQEVALNDAERKQKADAQRQLLLDKQRAQELKDANAAVSPVPTPKSAPEPPDGKRPGTAAPRTEDMQRIQQYEQEMRKKQASHAADQARRAEKAARAEEEAARTARRLREAAERKAKIQQRNEREPSTAQPLPAP
jgi:colicin import membrane protein